MRRSTFGLGLAAAAAVPAIARGAETGQPSIAIVGGGIAGLTAAMTLADRGYRSTIYEASERLGGRMHSERSFWNDGQVSEYCGELIDTDHVTMQALAKRFGLKLVDVNAAEPEGSADTLYFGGRYRTGDALVRDFPSIYRVLKEQIAASGGPYRTYDTLTAHGRALDATSVYEWIEKYVPGGHGSLSGELLDFAYVAENGTDTREQSALNLVYALGVQPASYPADPSAFNLLGPSDNRFHIVGGNERLPEAIAATLPPESIVRGMRLVAIARTPAGRVRLTFASSGGTVERVADRAIVAIPFSVLRGIDYSRAEFDARKTTAIERLGYGNNSKLITQYDGRPWTERGPWGRSDGGITTDAGFQTTWESSRAQPGKSGLLTDYRSGSPSAAIGVSAPYSTSADSSSTAWRARAFVAQLDEVWPGVARHYNGKAILSHPAADPLALGSYSCWLVGQYSAFVGYERVRQGNILFAGEHCSVRFPGFMEGGAAEGIRAAREI